MNAAAGPASANEEVGQKKLGVQNLWFARMRSRVQWKLPSQMNNNTIDVSSSNARLKTQLYNSLVAFIV